jgi:hypothetical protein
VFEEGGCEETVHLRRSKKGVRGARNRVGIGLSYRPARLHRLVESIPGILKRLQVRALYVFRLQFKDY